MAKNPALRGKIVLLIALTTIASGIALGTSTAASERFAFIAQMRAFLGFAKPTHLSAGDFAEPAVMNPGGTNLVISQVYGGGGNGSAVYQNDFVEIFNPTGSPISVSGWSVQYASATSSSWSVANLSGTVGAGNYYLVRLSSPAAVGSVLPAHDATNTSINIAVAAGKVVLTNTQTAFNVNCPSGASVIDFIGWGTTADCREGAGGTANNAPAHANATAEIRQRGGCADTDVNSTDVIVGYPDPRNSSSPAYVCSASTTAASDFFRTRISGDFTFANVWESSSDGSTNWIIATARPTSAANTISIRHNVPAAVVGSIDQVVIENGGTLNQTGSMTIANGVGDDVIIQSGGTLIYGTANATAVPPSTVLVSTNAVLRITNSGNIDPGADVNNGAHIYEHGSILEYSQTSALGGGLTVFPNVDAATVPIFRLVGGTVGSSGSNAATTINGIFEIASGSSISWAGSAAKIFRNGTRGAGTMEQDTTAGQLQITGGTAELGGGTINLNLTAGFQIASGSTTTLTSNKTFNGGSPITLSGTLDTASFTLSGTSGVTVANGGTLQGGGAVSNAVTVQSGGTVAPGSSAGKLTTTNTTFNSGANFNVEIGGTTAGTQYDQLAVTGTLALGGANLNLSALSFAPSGGQTFRIIDKTSAGAITGTFNGLAEGATITNFLGSGLSATISYTGGTGNDVVITVLAPPSPVTVTASAGTVGPTGYSTVKAAFDAINAGTHQGVISVSINSDTTESAAAVLNASGSGAASYTSISVTPSGARTVTGNLAAPIIDLNGADNVTINGLNSGGNSLQISNTSNSSASGTSTIRFVNGAQSNTVTNTTLRGSSMAPFSGGTVVFGETTTGIGNSSNTISSNNIGPAGANLPLIAIYSIGTTTNAATRNNDNQISANNIFDFFGTGNANTTGIFLELGNRNWTIANNRIYQTAPRTFTGGFIYAPINAGGSGDFQTISGNVIGFGASNGTGTTTISGATNGFKGIWINGGSNTNATVVQNNTISGINHTTSFVGGFAGATAFVAIDTASSALVNVSGNTIGSLDGSSTISITAPTGNWYAAGIRGTSTADTISANNIGAITVGGAATQIGFRGIRFETAGGGQVVTITNNTIGGAVPAGAIVNNISGNYETYGISANNADSVITGNTIRNITSNQTANVLYGINLTVNGTVATTVSGNTIHSLTTTRDVRGIDAQLALFANRVERNFVHSLVSSELNRQIWGIYLPGNANMVVANNMVRLGINPDGTSISAARDIQGLRDDNSGAREYYFNSVYIGGSGVVNANSDTYAFSSNTNTTRIFKNNIFWNARSNSSGTAKNYAIRTTTAGGLTSDRNDLLATGTGGMVGHYNSVDRATLSNWQSATGQDGASISVDPLFIAPNGTAATVNLHVPNTSPVYPAGVAIAGITTDFDGDTRLDPPAMGADEPPPPAPPAVTTNAATLVTTTTATLNGSANPNNSSANGRFRYSSTDPGACNDTFGTVTVNQPLGAGTSPVNFSQALSGLTANTTYYYCAIAQNAIGTAIGGLQQFTTPGPAAVVVDTTGFNGNFGNVTVGNSSGAQSYTVSGSNLTAALNINAPAHFQLSISASGPWVSTINLTPSSGTVNSTTIYVRFAPTSAGPTGSQNITNSSTGATTQNVVVQGNGIAAVCTAAPAGMVLWHRAEGAPSDALGTHNGSLVGGTTYTAGKVGQAYNMNGSNAGVTIPHNAALNPGASGFTVDFWMKSNAASSGIKLVVDKSHGFVDSLGWGFQSNAAGDRLAFFLGIGGAGITNFVGVESLGNVFDGNYHHIAGTLDSSNNVRLYVDGILQGTTPLGAAPANNTRPVNIGYAWGGGSPQRFFNGQVDEVEVFGRDLSLGEVQAIYNAGSAGKCEAPEIAIEVNSTDLIDGTSPVSFGTQAVSTTSAPVTFTVRNVGSQTLSLGTLTVDGAQASEFNISQPAVSSLAPGESTTFTGTFTPTATGVRNAAIHLVNGDANENPFDIPISGTGGSAGTLQFSLANYTVTEGTATATITITRTGGTTGAVSVGFGSAGASATGGTGSCDGVEDYIDVSGTRSWADADGANKTFTVTICNDSTYEGPETLALALSSPTGGATLGAPSTAVLTINDNDPPPTNLVVTKTADTNDGFCSLSDCSLREAIGAANFAAGSNTITFSSLFNTPQTITLAGDLLLVNNPSAADVTTITGPGAHLLTISGNNQTRIFELDNGDQASISGMTITGGNGDAGTSGSFPGYGGGIYNTGTMTLTGVVIFGNTTTIDGGGVYTSTSDVLNLIDSTVRNNSAPDGGGVYGHSAADVTITGSTINNNAATTGASHGGGGVVSFGTTVINRSTISSNTSITDGGGIYVGAASGEGTITITNSTIAGNTATRDGGGVFRGPSVIGITLRSSIVGNNSDDGTAPDFSGSFDSQGFNLIENTTGATISGVTATNITGADPALGGLQNNGGLTATHALLAGSPAIDKGDDNSASPTTDQRGSLRPVDDPNVPNAAGGDGTDIGAFELEACAAPPSGMVGWWPAEGNANDVAGPNSGTAQGGLTYSTGKVGQAFNMDGVDDSIDLGTWFTLQSFTIDMWVNPGVSQVAFADLIDNNHTNFQNWVIQYDNTGNQWHYGAADGAANSITFNLVPGVWQHLAVTRDNSNVAKVYINGSLIGTSTGTGPITYSSQFLRLGRWGGGGRNFNGRMDEVEIFNRALSGPEIEAIANAGNAGKCHTSTVSVAVSPTSVLEDGPTNLTYTFTRNGDISGPLTANFSIGGTASFSGGDYSQTGAATFDSPSGQGTVAFAGGNATATVTVDPTADLNFEPNETVDLTVISGAGYSVGSPSLASGTINNDDGQAETNVVLNSGNVVITDVQNSTNDTLTISFVTGPDRIRVHDPNNVLGCGAGTTAVDPNTCDVPAGSVTGSLTVDAGGGNDTLTLALANGDVIPAGGLFYNGGTQTGAPGDTLNITGGSQGDVTYNYTNANNGNIVMTGGTVSGTITYTGLEPISNSGNAANAIFNLPAGPSAATLSDLGGGITQLASSPATFETTAFSNPTQSVTINRGNAADTMAVGTLATNYPGLTIGTSGAPFGTINFNGAVSTASNKGVSVAAGDVNSSAAGTISTGSAGLAIYNTGTASTLSGAVGGGGSFTKQGTGQLIFPTSNTYTGTTTVNNGILTVQNAGALGTAAAGTTVATGAQLQVSGGLTVASETLTLNGSGTSNTGALRNVSGNNTWSGAVLLNSSTTLGADSGSTLTLGGVISGGAGANLTKEGAGTLILSGTNTYTGSTTINQGVLRIQNDSGLGLAPSAPTPGHLNINGNLQIADLTSVTINPNRGTTVGPNTGAGAGTIETLAGSTATYAGIIANNGSSASGLTKSGPGTLVLSGANTYSGVTNISAGTLVVNGAIVGPTTISNPSVLGGTGTTGTVNNSGTIAPGNSPGILNTGNVVFNSGSVFSVEVNGSTAGTQHDQLNVTGTVDLGGATLSTSGTLTSSPGQQIRIINNDSNDAITGTFAGLVEGAAVTINGVSLKITYTGGDGNDVVLVEPPPPTVTINQAAGQSDPTSGSPINFTVVFSGPVTDFDDVGDVTLGGTAAATTAAITGGPTTFNVAVSGMTSSGTVIATVPAGAATDGLNTNVASTSTDNIVEFVLCPSFPATIAAGDVAGLKVAINCANSNGAGTNDVINLTNSTYTLTAVDNDLGGFDGPSGLPTILGGNGTLTINGNGATITRASAAQFRHFFVNTGANLTLNDLTLTGGSAPFGGSIRSNGTFTIDRSTVSGNTAGTAGGGFYNGGISTVRNSTFTANSSTFDGGGIYHGGAGISIVNSTISGNTAGQSGAGIFAFYAGELRNSTVVSNTATTSGGGLYVDGTPLQPFVINSSIIAGNSAASAPDVQKLIAIFTESYNLIGNNTGSGITAGSPNANNSYVGTGASPINAMLGPLANNGGPTMMHAPLAGSLAIDKGINPLALSTDQRGAGFLRTIDQAAIPPAAGGDNTDIGAFEVQNITTANLYQCANGGVGDPVEPCTGTAWVDGNVNDSKAHWIEGQSVPYRQVLTGFTTGTTGHTVTIGYDTTKGGKHAIDYLTSFDRTETLAMGNNPCSGVPGCSLGTFTTFPIPIDPNVTNGFNQINGDGDDITQIPGVFTLFGGTLTGVSAYTTTGSYAGDSHTSITITFTADSANMVLSWGGHLASPADWGIGNTAENISGSPYHMTQDSCSFGCGAQDRALSGTAVAPLDGTPPDTTIDSNPPNPSASSSASFTFSGTDAGGSGVASFECKLDAGSFAPCTSPKNYAGLADGPHTFQVRAIDGAGNIDATPASYTWVIDTTPPDTIITSGPPDPSNSSSGSIVFSSPDADATTFVCELDGNPVACTSPSYNFAGLPDGPHTFEVSAVDGAGNVDPTPGVHTWTIDATPPTVTINQASGQADPTSASPIDFTVVFSEPVTDFDDAADVTLSGTAGASSVAITGGPTTYNVAVSGMTQGGTVTASIPAGAATDGLNTSAASTSTDNTVTYQPPPCFSGATMTGSQVFPPNASAATGTATVFRSLDDLFLEVNWSGLTAPATSAHVHGPASPGTNASAIFSFSGVSTTSGSVVGFFNNLTPTQMAWYEAGLLYVDIHTSIFPGGEIRGQLLPTQPCGYRELTINDVSQTEGDAGTTTFTFTVSLSSLAPVGGVTFDIATADGTAQDDNPVAEDNDYVAKSLTSQTIPAGQTSYTFNVTVNGDTQIESDETFLVNVTNVTGAAVIDGQGQGTIQNDDFDLTPPKVDSIVPANNSTGVALNTNITITFSEIVNIGAGGITLNCGGPVAFSPTLPQNGVTSITLNPNDDLPYNALCTVTGISASISDQVSNALDGNGDGTGGDDFVSTFTTTCLAGPLTVLNTNNAGPNSLRQHVNDICPGGTINFSTSTAGGATDFDDLPADVIQLSTGQIVIPRNMTIVGPGSDQLTVENTAAAGSTSRVLRVDSGVAATISGMTISGGDTTADGGGILNLGNLTANEVVISGNAASGGGGISNRGSLTLGRSTVRGNTSSSGAGGVFMANGGSALIFASTISGNTGAQTGGVGIQTQAGGPAGNLTIWNSTISGNTGGSVAGGVLAFDLGPGVPITTNIFGSTITNNSGPQVSGAGTGGIAVGINLGNTIVASNIGGPQVVGVISSTGYNIFSDASLVVTQATDQLNTNPLIAPLADNGGPTQTHALCVAVSLPHASCTGLSTAIDKGRNFVPSAFDQRGPGPDFDRPFDNPAISPAAGGDNSDIGSFEVNNTPPVIAPAGPLTRQAGSPGGAAVQIATVADPDQPLDTLVVTANPPPGITVTNITVGANGVVTAVVGANCGTAPGQYSVPLTVTDNQGAQDIENLVVNVTPNTGPNIAYPSPVNTVHGEPRDVAPTTNTDNGSITGYGVFSVPAMGAAPSINQTTGVVSLPFSTEVGTYQIFVTATDNCGQSSITSFTLNVAKANTTTTITSDNPDPSVVGQPYTVNVSVAVVAPGGGIPTGLITVTDGAGATCTANLPATSCQLTSIVAGAKTLTATYAGDAHFNGSSDTEPHNVSTSNTVTTIVSDVPDPTVTGQPYTVTATVAPTGGGGGTPTGTITVTDGTGGQCVITLPAASCDLTSTTAGAKTLTATYSGDNNYNTSNTTTAHQVNKADTTVVITSDTPDPSVVGQPYAVNATVSVAAPGGGTPQGTITITDGTSQCVITLPATSCNLASTSPGAKTLVATYSGNADYNSSISAGVPHQVNKANSTVTITSTPDPSVFGQAVTLNITVAAASPGAGTPTGTVQVSQSAGPTTCFLTLSGGTASCQLTPNAAGTVTFTATYNGDVNFNFSTGTDQHTVNKANTTTTIVTDTPDPTVVGQPYAVTVTVAPVSPGVGTPTGTVTVTDGTGAQCTITLPQTSCNLTSTTAGTKTLTATYNGDGAFNTSNAAANTTHTVNAAGTVTTITSDTPDPSGFGQPVAVTVTVAAAAPGAGTPTGTVTVTETGGGTCNITLAAGTGTCSLTPAGNGATTITAAYAGDGNFTASNDTEPHTVGKANVVVTVVDLPDPTVVGQPYTANVTVTPQGGGAGTPTGTVNVTDGSGGTCTITLPDTSCTLSSSSPGVKNLTATYSGDANFNTAANTTPHTVNKANTTTTVTTVAPEPSAVNTPYTVTFTVTANSPATGTPTGTVTVSDGTGASCTATVAQGSCTLISATAGTKMITASYPGDANYNPSTSAGFQHVVTGVQGPTGPGFEGDIDRPVGQESTPSQGDGQVDQRDLFWYDQFSRLLHCPAETPNEFQRLDGNDNGFIDGGDYNVIFNTFLGLQPKVAAKGTATRPAGLCTGVPPAPEEMEDTMKASPDGDIRQTTRSMKLVPIEADSRQVVVALELEAQGDEMYTSTTLRFDPKVLTIDGTSGIDTNPDVLRGSSAREGQVIGVNATESASGIISIAVDMTGGTGRPIARGTRQIVHLVFRVRDDVRPGTGTTIELTDTQVPQQTVDAKGSIVPVFEYRGTMIVLGSKTGRGGVAAIQGDVRSIAGLLVRPRPPGP